MYGWLGSWQALAASQIQYFCLLSMPSPPQLSSIRILFLWTIWIFVVVSVDVCANFFIRYIYNSMEKPKTTMRIPLIIIP